QTSTLVITSRHKGVVLTGDAVHKQRPHDPSLALWSHPATGVENLASPHGCHQATRRRSRGKTGPSRSAANPRPDHLRRARPRAIRLVLRNGRPESIAGWKARSRRAV